ncbi:uncharacterized protein HMPREF1541_00615 [Cyphellophora europaea CBS 101466]|uniref:BUB protein kinase n=1 Tax=Cyphellophora europaea (strain CBS 101466) TaxID=1220924 RepID=W2SCJ7_CYPE1|nr:uncharacterized protein HMPREF1541_00615 [Cyphellophora europaea CBS 101466]ETN46431.1 hypothetical protein HMPREF1541_00615 [Cyphellophora europaea CBS 101466]
MAAGKDELIDFSILENSKENIQSLPGGRSAKQLAAMLSPKPLNDGSAMPTLEETKTLNDAIRQEYEIELQSISDADDPLDIYDRYVKWTLNAYPSAQATPQSQLLPLLERATKAFLTSSHYKNDPRYLKLWLHYIRFFSDTPRETFAFLARHSIGDTLGLFYEEFAAWLEGAGRWNQADEVYQLGIEREARPAERLMKKYQQFQARFDARPQNADEPSSPALPKVRAALATKIDPFAPSPAEDPQAAARQAATRPTTSRSGKPKMAIFSDGDDAPVPAQSATQGWDSIGSMKERRKENTIEAKPWTGEKLKAGAKVGTGSKMEIFRDPSLRNNESKKPPPSKIPDVVNPRTGRVERVAVDIESIYPKFPNENIEFCFEELRAARRGWTDRDWRRKPQSPMRPVTGNEQRAAKTRKIDSSEVENITQGLKESSIVDTSTQSMVGMPEGKSGKPRKKVREVKEETKTVKLRLESPTGAKIKRKGSSEPTMTFNSKAAHNDIYDMFNQPLRKPDRDDTQSGDETDYGDDTYSEAESTGTGRISAATSEFGDDTLARVAGGDAVVDYTQGSQPTSVSPWSDFTASKHVPKFDLKKSIHRKHSLSEDLTENLDSTQEQTQTSGISSFDTQAIAAIANQDFNDMKTQDIARLAGEFSDGEDSDHQNEEITNEVVESESASLKASTEPDSPQQVEVNHPTRFIPLPPEDYQSTPAHTYRSADDVAQNRLPFMTPIAEATESSIGSTIFKNKIEDDRSESPSRIGSKSIVYDSPSKLKLENLMMSSPQQGTPEQSPKKESPPKRRLIDTIEEEELLTGSPRKLKVDHKASLGRALALHTESGTRTLESAKSSVSKAAAPEPKIPDSPIITMSECLPMTSGIRTTIMERLEVRLTEYEGYHEDQGKICDKWDALRKIPNKNSTGSPKKKKSSEVELDFENSSRVYAVKRLLGRGAFASAFLVKSTDRDAAVATPAGTPSTSPRKSIAALSRSVSPVEEITGRADYECIKMESEPESRTMPWEFHVIRLVASRITAAGNPRVLQSLVCAHECHIFPDEAYLVLSYSPQGNMIELVNTFRASTENTSNLTGLEESVVAFFAIEALRTMEALHAVGVLHGDIKADNCMVRFDPKVEVVGPYNKDGANGWASKGLKFIDFGRSVDTKCFSPDTKFKADWTGSPQDCPQIRHNKPFKWAIDWYGTAGMLNVLLVGNHLEYYSNVLADGSVEHMPKEKPKRWFDRPLWAEVFQVLLNKGDCPDDDVRVAELARVRALLEDWLEKEGESEKHDLRGKLRAAEALVAARKE